MHASRLFIVFVLLFRVHACLFYATRNNKCIIPDRTKASHEESARNTWDQHEADRGHRAEMKYMRCLDVRLCDMHGEGSDMR